MASRRGIRRKECEGKIRYADRDAAVAEARAMIRRQNHRAAVSTYRCRWCNHWHVGHTPYRYSAAGKGAA